MRNKTKVLIIGFLLFFNIYTWEFLLSQNNNLKIVFFDVGQGDSIFIETPQKHQILIDGGPSEEVILKKLSNEMPFWDRSIDLVILTHPDFDHLNGLNAVLAKYKVKNILWTGISKGTKTFKRWEEKLKEEKANVFIAKKGEKIKAGQARFFVFYPFENLNKKFFSKDTNDTSIVLKLLFGRNSFLFTGDISKGIEEQLLDLNLETQVLKVAHHGSKFSTSEDFLKQTSPEFAVISVGRKNYYSHPHEAVLQRLREFGINVLRTDKLGDITISSDKYNLFLNYGKH